MAVPGHDPQGGGARPACGRRCSCGWRDDRKEGRRADRPPPPGLRPLCHCTCPSGNTWALRAGEDTVSWAAACPPRPAVPDRAKERGYHNFIPAEPIKRSSELLAALIKEVPGLGEGTRAEFHYKSHKLNDITGI